MEINIDFETRSTTDLMECGVYRYVEDPFTDVWCMAYQIADDPVVLWLPNERFPSVIEELLTKYNWGLRAWNAQFERLIWNMVCVRRYGFPRIPRHRFFCTMADALAMGLPASLDKAAAALRLKTRKDMDGNRLAKQMSKPRKTVDGVPVWWDVPDKVEKLYRYCEQDVRVEHAMMKATRRLGEYEREVYLLDQKINDRGVHIDQHLVRVCRKVALEGIRRANAVVAQTTDGDVEAITQVGKLQYWLREQGCDIPDLTKTSVQQYLEQDLPPNVRDVLLARAEAGKASVAKLDKMLQVSCADSCARGLLQYHAAHTGRWGGRLIQPQNLPRGEVKDAEHFIELLLSGTMPYDALDLHANPVGIVSSLLRSMLTAREGHRLMAGDFSAIEARVLAWLAGQDDLVRAFASGEDVYATTGTEFGTTRQCGKAIILGAGFGMGGDKFKLMGETQYGIDFEAIEVPRGVTVRETDDGFRLTYPSWRGESTVDVESYAHAIAHAFVRLYRFRYPRIPQFWWNIEQMMLQAVLEPGSVQEVGGIKASCRGRFLWLVLPSKRPLCYMDPSVVMQTTPWGEERPSLRHYTQDGFTKKWVRAALYGGLIVENIVQAVSRDLMVHSMIEADKAGYPIVLTVHDEIVADVPEGSGTFEEYSSLLSRVPDWAGDLPMKVSGWEGKRYRKD